MSRDLDTRARQAAANLKAAIAAAELSAAPPGEPRPRRRMVALLRPAWVIALLLIGSAVGVAMVMDSSPTSTTVPPATTTTLGVTTSVVAEESTVPAPPTTAAVAPVAPPTAVAPDTVPPLLEITTPEDGAEMAEKTITFAGVTEPGARVFAGKYQADVEPSGEWHIVLILSEGKNVARFVASDAAGNESEASVTVYYVTPATTTTEPTIEKELSEFSALATYGSCTSAPPYDVYYGTGEPGSVVSITSEHGSGETTVGENGEWEKQVFFEGAPPNEMFGVRISDNHDRVRELEFVYTP